MEMSWGHLQAFVPLLEHQTWYFSIRKTCSKNAYPAPKPFFRLKQIEKKSQKKSFKTIIISSSTTTKGKIRVTMKQIFMDISDRFEAEGSSSEIEKSISSSSTTMIMLDNKTTKSAKKSVRFAPSVQVHAVEALDEYSEREICDMWYGENDLLHIRNDCMETLRRMVKKSTLDTATYCSRGLENKTPEGLKKRQQNKYASLDAVLDAQESHWDRGVECSPDIIATVYKTHSTPCQARANRLGLRDEKYVRAMIQEEQCQTAFLLWPRGTKHGATVTVSTTLSVRQQENKDTTKIKRRRRSPKRRTGNAFFRDVRNHAATLKSKQRIA